MNTSISKLRKLVAMFSVATLLASLLVVSPAMAAVPAQFSWAGAAAEAYGDAAKFNELGNSLNKCEYAKIVATALALTPDATVATGFTDVADWAKGYVGVLFANKVVEGRSATVFGCSEPVQRAEMVVMLARAFNWDAAGVAEAPMTPAQEAEFASAGWAKKAFAQAMTLGVVKGYPDGTVRPGQGAVKAEGFVVAYRAATGEDGSSAPATPAKDGSLHGGAGSVDTYDLISSVNNEEVGEGEDDVQVFGVEIEADDSSDLGFSAFRLELTQDDGHSDKFEDYASEVSVWQGDEELARVDADAFNDDNDYTKTISFDEVGIVRAGDTEKFYVAVSGVSNLDSDDVDGTWTVDLTLVRFKDGQGALVSEDPGVDSRDFDFVTFASSSDAELQLSLSDDDDVNDAHVIDIDDNNDTNNVPVLSFELEVKGDSDMYLDALPVMFTTVGGNVDDTLTGVTLTMDGEEVGSENLADQDDTQEVTFEDLGLDLDAGETYAFEVLVDVFSTDDGVADGDTVQATIGTDQRDDIDIEDEEGEDVEDRSGTANGEAHALYDNGIMVELVSTSKTRSFTADDSGEYDRGTFEITFDVTAFGADMRVDKSCKAGGENAAGQGVEYTDMSNTTESCSFVSSSTDSEDTSNTFEVDEDTTRRFTLTVEATATADVFAEASLESINWGTATDNSNANYYTFNLDEYKTGSLFLNAF